MGNGALALRVAAGDRIAFGELYDELSDRVFAFCICLLGNRDEAADATHDAFALAMQRIDQLRDPERIEAWVFAIARHVCYRRLEHRKRHTPLDLGDAPPTELVLDEIELELTAHEAADLVWTAAEGLSERDRAVLYLNTHEGLDGADLAAALGVQHANPYSMLHRAKEQLSLAIGAILVARAGKRDCPQLATMLEQWDGHLTPLLRKRLTRHIGGCAACRHTKSKALRLSAFAAVPLVMPKRAEALPNRHSLDRLREIAARHPMANERWRRDGFPPSEDERKRKRRWFALLFGVLALGLAVPLAIGTASAGSPSRPSSVKPPPAVTTTTSASRAAPIPPPAAATAAAPPATASGALTPTTTARRNSRTAPVTAPGAVTPEAPAPVHSQKPPKTTTTVAPKTTTTQMTIPT